MARITSVDKARVRYPTVPTIDPTTGRQIVVPVTRKDGSPKLTKSGRPVTRALTHEDRTAEPLPNHVCDRCRAEIKPGDPYKWIAPRSGPYGGRKMYRCGKCPAWHVWEYSSSLSAQLAQVSHEFGLALNGVESEDDVQSALDEAADQIREIAGAKRESAQNIEDGFGHATYQSDDLNSLADDLESWADEVASATIPEFPEPEDGEEEITGEQLDEWRGEVSGELTIVDEAPV